MSAQTMSYTYGNAWNNVAVLADGVSNTITVSGTYEYLAAWGISGADTTITLQQFNGSTWDNKEDVDVLANQTFAIYYEPTGGDFRLKSSEAATITSTIGAVDVIA
jgi:hypothetical protein